MTPPGPSRFRIADLGASRLFDDVTPAAPGVGGKAREVLLLLLSVLVGVIGGFLVATIILVILGVALLISGGGESAVIQDILSALQSGSTPDTLPTTLTLISMLAILNGIAFFMIVFLASLIRRQSIWRNFTSAPRFRWRQLLLGFVLYAIFMAGLLGIEVALGVVEPEWPVLALTNSAGEIALFVVVALIGFTIAAGAEELLFRGWLMRQTAAFGRNVIVLLIVNGVLFSLIHLDPDPNAFIARAAMGVVFGWMALRLGGIEFATGAHAANNILLVLLMEPLPIVAPPPEPFTAHYLIETVALLVFGILITEAAVRIPALRRAGGIEELPTRYDDVFD